MTLQPLGVDVSKENRGHLGVCIPWKKMNPGCRIITLSHKLGSFSLSFFFAKCLEFYMYTFAAAVAAVPFDEKIKPFKKMPFFAWFEATTSSAT